MLMKFKLCQPNASKRQERLVITCADEGSDDLEQEASKKARKVSYYWRSNRKLEKGKKV